MPLLCRPPRRDDWSADAHAGNPEHRRRADAAFRPMRRSAARLVSPLRNHYRQYILHATSTAPSSIPSTNLHHQRDRCRQCDRACLRYDYCHAASEQTQLHHLENKNEHTGEQRNETALTTANVIQQLWIEVYPRRGRRSLRPAPLSFRLTVNATRHNVGFVATEHDSVYAFDADVAGSALWQPPSLREERRRHSLRTRQHHRNGNRHYRYAGDLIRRRAESCAVRGGGNR